MNRAWQACGRLAFWLSWPGLWLYLHWSHRTRVLVVHGSEILLVKSWLGDGRWGLPGGGRHRHEAAIDCARRELFEETGLTVEPGQLEWRQQRTSYLHGLRVRYDLYALVLASKPALHRQKQEISAVAWIDTRTISPTELSDDAAAAVQHWFD